jgi:hypothetical protein
LERNNSAGAPMREAVKEKNVQKENPAAGIAIKNV